MARTAAAIRALRRLNQYKEGRTVQPGMFSTLDEAIKEAPFETNSAKGWADHLQPGRMVKRQGSEFAVKKEELVHSGLSERLSSGIFADQPITKDVLLDQLRSSRPTFRLETGREVYDNLGEHTIKIDEDAVFPRAWDETFKHSEVDPTTGNPLDMDRINVMNPRFGDEYSGSGRYHHTSPNSTYEESFTKLQGLVAPTHHTQDTLSWSRVSIHKSPYEVYGIDPRSIRLVEEIQADVHRKAAQKLYRDPQSGEHFTSREAAEAKTSWDPEDIEEVGRVGYRDENTPLEMAALKEEAAQLDNRLKKLDPLTAAGNPSRKYQTLTDDFNKAMSDLERLEMKMHDAPHKKPQDYAQLELRKQLMNAADEGDTHLALVRGRDQIERYRDIEVLSPKKQASMERMYDKIYAGELRKLAKRYGATVEDIELEVRSVKDIRTETMRDLEIEHPDEYFDDVILEMKKSKEPELVSTDIEHLADMIDEVKMSLSNELGDSAHFESFDNMLNQLDQIKADAKRLQAQSQVRGRRAEYMNTVVAKTRAVKNEFAARFKEYQDIMGVGDPGALTTKSFPAIVITPEVRERILEAGVAQFQRGGLVRPDAMPGMEYVPSREALSSATEEELTRLREINFMLSGGEAAEEMNRIRELDQLYNDPQYWKDVPRHALAAMKSQWKTLDPETGESTWNFGAAPPPWEMVERGIMSLEEWKEMKKVADRVRKEKPPRPGIIDETMAMRAMMTEVANMFRDERVEPPKYAAEAMERSISLQEATEGQMGLSPAEGFPQRFAQMFGFMAGQIPSPKSLTEVAGKLVTKLAPSFTKRIPKAVKVGIGAPMEFMDPTIRPALSTYLTGAAAGTGLIYGIEATAEAKLKALEEKLEENAEQE